MTPSSGFRRRASTRNGFTLVRKVLEDEDYTGDDLLAPDSFLPGTACGSFVRWPTQARSRARHGGGILGNLARILPDGLAADIDWMRLVGHQSSAGSRVMSPRTSYGACSTSGSATSRSWISATASRSGPSCGRDRRPRERGGHEPASAARRGASGRSHRVQHCRRSSARERAGGGSRHRCLPPGRPCRLQARDAAMAGTGSNGTASTRSVRGLHAAPEPLVPRPLPEPRRERPSVAPLPEFPGAHPFSDPLAAGASAAAATVYYVDDGVDTGAVIASVPVPVIRGDTVEIASAHASNRLSIGCCLRWCESCARADLRLRQRGSCCSRAGSTSSSSSWSRAAAPRWRCMLMVPVTPVESSRSFQSLEGRVKTLQRTMLRSSPDAGSTTTSPSSRSTRSSPSISSASTSTCSRKSSVAGRSGGRGHRDDRRGRTGDAARGGQELRS